METRTIDLIVAALASVFCISLFVTNSYVVGKYLPIALPVLFFSIGVAYPIIARRAVGGTVPLISELVRGSAHTIIAQSIGFAVYWVKSGAVQRGDSMALVLFLVLLLISLTSNAVGVLIGHLASGLLG